MRLKPSFQKQKICTIYFDGSSKPNPGKMGIGVCIVDEDTDESFMFTKYIGEGTNNVAEFTAALIGIYIAIKKGYQNITLLGDSALTINGINGDWNIRHENLVPILEKVNEFKKSVIINAIWIPRELNIIADELSTKKN